MANPKKGYKAGVYRFVSGTVNASGDFSITNIPKEGYVSGIYKLTTVTVDGSGDASSSENDIGLSRYIAVTVDGAGDLSVTATPQEGYVPGVFRVTTSTNVPKEGLNKEDFSGVNGNIVGGIWTPV